MVTESYHYAVEDHVCRVCLGRLLSRVGGDGAEVRCSECGLAVQGGPSELCLCGAKLHDGRDAGFRCMRKADHQPGIGPEIVGELVEAPRASAGRRSRAESLE